MQKDEAKMKKAILHGGSFVIFITFLAPIIGVLIWFIPKYLNPLEYEGCAFDLPSFVPEGERINNPLTFYVVALIHKYIYLGIVIGLVGVVILNFRIKRKNKIADALN